MVAINRMKDYLPNPRLPEQEPVRDNRWLVMAFVAGVAVGVLLDAVIGG